MLTFDHYVMEYFGVRSNKDRRKFVDRWVLSYYDEYGNEYRKSFETVKGVKPNVPINGTHFTLAQIQYQF